VINQSIIMKLITSNNYGSTRSATMNSNSQHDDESLPLVVNHGNIIAAEEKDATTRRGSLLLLGLVATAAVSGTAWMQQQQRQQPSPPMMAAQLSTNQQNQEIVLNVATPQPCKEQSSESVTEQFIGCLLDANECPPMYSRKIGQSCTPGCASCGPPEHSIHCYTSGIYLKPPVNDDTVSSHRPFPSVRCQHMSIQPLPTKWPILLLWWQ
jgi:hypothetical protein